MYKFPSIEAFYQVARYLKKINKDPEYPEEYKVKTPIWYRGTVKLHGTNASIHHSSDDNVICQSRTRVITPEVDNAGFASFVAENRNAVLEICKEAREKNEIAPEKDLVIYGEWIGPGIQKGMAINSLPERQWVIFGFKVIDGEDQQFIDYTPEYEDRFKEQNIFSIFDGDMTLIRVDFDNPESSLSYIERITEETEKECPWGRKFGLKGIGEGVVWVPTGNLFGRTELSFKSKGEKHKEIKSKNKNELEPEILNSINEFVNFSLTENRLNHGIEAIKEAGHVFETKSLGHYLKWIAADIQRECRFELEDNKLEWKMVSKSINEKARKFFINKVNSEL